MCERCGNRRNYVTYPGKIVADNGDDTVQVEFDDTKNRDMSVYNSSHAIQRNRNTAIGDDVESTFHNSKWLTPVAASLPSFTEQEHRPTRLTTRERRGSRHLPSNGTKRLRSAKRNKRSRINQSKVSDS